MAKFNLHPLCLALLGAASTSVFANNSTDATFKPPTFHDCGFSGRFEQELKNAPASI